ncbi:AAA family ATPase [Aureimonas sp. SK2]|uniref:AAA family ATPase n=1 Tax=Aureimonas sp. SK2 TaxID=3015992 RepID=UPI0024442452|nr:AAA family ATPase [Aureimonas sp. SK2]
MHDRLDFNDLPTSLAGRLTPSALVADALLRQTITEGGCERFFEGGSRLVVIHGVRPDDASVLCDAVHDLIGGTVECFVQINASARDWTDLASQRPQYVERLLMDASVSTRPLAVLSRRRTEVPGVVGTVADGVIPLARSQEAIADIVREAAGFQPDERLLARLARLPLPFLNLAIRPGMSADRMWRIAGRLVRHRPELERERRPAKLTDAKVRKPSDASVVATPQPAPERLEDLPGMGEAGRWGLRLAADLAEYRAGTLPWSDLESGMLLHGPPGTGKTLFARALAGSCEIPLHSHSIAAWQAKGHLGDMLKAMRAAFAEARKSAPCILFLDELDSVGSRDEPLGDNASYQRQVVNGLLECLDGAAQRDGIIVVGATNKPDVIDRAVLRPGRLGRHIEVRLPDLAGRVGILEHHLRGELPDANLMRLADEFGEASGAALAQLVREARGLARRVRRSMSEADLWAALPPGVLLSDAAFRRMCVHEAGHVVAGLEMAAVSGLVPTRVRVRRRVRDGEGNQTDFDVLEGIDQSRESVEAQIVVMLGGLAAEEVLLGSRSTLGGGSRDADLVRATRLATSFEFSFGLGGHLHSVPTTELASAAAWRDGERSRDRVEQVLGRCFGKAKAIVERRREEINALASRLAKTNAVTLT